MSTPPVENPSSEQALLGVQALPAFIFKRALASPCTLGLIVACVSLELLVNRWGPGDWRSLILEHSGERRWSAVRDGEVYRVLASSFLHRDTKHLFDNMRALVVFGLLLEPALGARRFVILYAAVGLAAALPYTFIAQDISAVGASGAIAGLGLVLVGYRLRFLRPLHLHPSRAANAILVMLGLFGGGALGFAVLARSRYLFAGGVVWMLVAEVLPPRNLAHLGGAFAGLLLGYTLLIRPKQTQDQTAKPERTWLLSLLAAASTVVLVGSIGWALAVGRPWQLRDAPALATVALPDTSFTADLPEVVSPDLTHREGDSQSRFFAYGDSRQSPVTLSIFIQTQRFDTTPARHAAMVFELQSRTQLEDDERWRSISRLEVDGLPMVRVDYQGSKLVKTSVYVLVDGFGVSVTGFRQPWAYASPRVWEGVEEDVASSFRKVEN